MPAWDSDPIVAEGQPAWANDPVVDDQPAWMADPVVDDVMAERPSRFESAVGSFTRAAGRGVSDIPKSVAIEHGEIHQATLDRYDAIDRGEQPNAWTGLREEEYAKASPEGRAKLRTEHIERADTTKYPSYKLGQDIDKFIASKTSVDPAYEQEFWSGKVPAGLGSMVSYVATGVTAALGARSGRIPAPVASGGAVSLQASKQSSVAGFEDAIESGASLEDAYKSSNMNEIMGYSEALPIARILDRVDKGTGGSVKRAIAEAAKAGTEEAIQEASQTIYQNLVASEFVGYDPNRGVLTGSGEGAGVGFTTGALVQFLGTVIGGRRAKPALTPEERDAEAITRITSAPDVDSAITAAMESLDTASLDEIQAETDLDQQLAGLGPTTTQTNPQAPDTIYMEQDLANAAQSLRAQKRAQKPAALPAPTTRAKQDVAQFREDEALNEQIQQDVEQFKQAETATSGTPAKASVITDDRRANPEKRVRVDALKQQLAGIHEAVARGENRSTELLEVAGRLRDELHTDDLTSLPNLMAFEEHIAQNPNESVLFGDLDYFKKTNDEMGHDGADLVLKKVADLKREVAQELGTRAYRRSGDEFLGSGADPATLEKHGQEVQKRLANATITVRQPDGSTKNYTGFGFSYGVGKTREEAESNATRQKAERRDAGLREGARDTQRIPAQPAPGQQDHRRADTEVQDSDNRGQGLDEPQQPDKGNQAPNGGARSNADEQHSDSDRNSGVLGKGKGTDASGRRAATSKSDRPKDAGNPESVPAAGKVDEQRDTSDRDGAANAAIDAPEEQGGASSQVRSADSGRLESDQAGESAGQRRDVEAADTENGQGPNSRSDTDGSPKRGNRVPGRVGESSRAEKQRKSGEASKSAELSGRQSNVHRVDSESDAGEPQSGNERAAAETDLLADLDSGNESTKTPDKGVSSVRKPKGPPRFFNAKQASDRGYISNVSEIDEFNRLIKAMHAQGREFDGESISELREITKEKTNGNTKETQKAAQTAEVLSVADAADQAATSPESDAPKPTEAQLEAGNFQKGHVSINGLNISIEYPAGVRRRPGWPALKQHYGYIRLTEDRDGEQIDVFLTDQATDETLPVFVIDQVNKEGRFDEHKVVMGMTGEQVARDAYLSNYPKGWKGLGAITKMTWPEFKEWLQDGNTKKPAAKEQPLFSKTVGPRDTSLAAAWKMLAQFDETFEQPTSKHKDISKIAEEIDPDIKVTDETWLNRDKSIAKKWRITMPDGRKADVTEKTGGNIILNASLLKAGESRGSALYNIVATYAHNNGKVFIGDPEGLSSDALYRRTENMISTALRFGTTRHIWPHPDQVTKLKIDWEDGQDAHNLDEMLKASYTYISKHFPQIEDISYDFESGQFKATSDESGTGGRVEDVFTDAAFKILAKPAGPGAARAGSRTLKRAALTGTVLREAGKGSEGRKRLLGSLVQRLSAGVADTPLKGILYRKETRPSDGFFNSPSSIATGPRGPGLSVSNIQSIIDEFSASLKGVPDIEYTVERTQKEAFGADARTGDHVKGGYYAKTGQIVLVAENITSRADALRVLRHETLAHFGLNTLPAETKNAIIQKITESRDSSSLKKIWESVDRDYDEASEETKAEEVLARIAEDPMGRLSKLWNDILRLIEEGLRKVGLLKAPITKAELREMVEALADRIRRGSEQRSTDAQPAFSKEGTAPPFFSALKRAAESLKQDKGTAEQFLSQLKNQPGVKAEELYFTGLEEYLTAISREASIPESVSDSIARHANFLRNIIKTDAFKSKGFGGLDIPTKNAVLEKVFAAGQDSKVREAIISALPVDMVDILAEQELTPEMLFHDESVLKNLFPIDPDVNVPISPDVATAFVRSEAFKIAELIDGSPDVAGPLSDRAAAVSAVNKRHKNIVTKKEIIDYLEANGVQVETVTKSDGRPDRVPEFKEVSRTENDGDITIRYETDDGRVIEADLTEGADNYDVAELRPGTTTVIANIGVSTSSEITTEEEISAAISEYLAGRNDIVSSKETKFDQYQLPGGENYREVLLTLPAKDTQEQRDADEVRRIRAEGGRAYRAENSPSFRSSHFDEPNILAHIRLNDRTDADGNKVLFVEEIQSDWHQAARKKGYRPQSNKSAEELNKRRLEIEAKGKDATPDEKQEWADAMSIIEGNGVPDAPFKNNAWAELAIKRVLRMAAEGGYASVAWTTGEQQNERYDLSKQVDRVDVGIQPNGKYELVVYKDDATVLEKSDLTAPELEDHIGKDLAQKAVTDLGEPTKGFTRTKDYSGDGLKIGGAGMKGFYDKILPNLFNKVAGKLDKEAKVGRADVKLYMDGTGQHSLPITDKMREGALAGQPLFSKRKREPESTQTAPQRAVSASGQANSGNIAGMAAEQSALKAANKEIEYFIEKGSDLDPVIDVLSIENIEDETIRSQVKRVAIEAWFKANGVKPTFITGSDTSSYVMFNGEMTDDGNAYAKIRFSDHENTSGRFIGDEPAANIVNQDFYTAINEISDALDNSAKEQGIAYTAPRRKPETAQETSPPGPLNDGRGRFGQTTTKAFRDWFAGSQVTDADGKPLVVYHASMNKAFNVFDTSKEGAHFGSLEQASNLSGFKRNKPRSFYLSIQNPLRLPDLGVWSNFQNVHGHLSVNDHITMEEADAAWDAFDRSDAEGWSALKSALAKRGYDSIVYENEQEGSGDSYIAFHPSQIKSAIGNRGTFDPSNPNILYSKTKVETEFSRENRRLREEHKTLWNKAKGYYRRQFMPGGLLPQDVFKEKIQRDSEIQVVEFDINHLTGSLENIVKGEYGAPFEKLDRATMLKLNRALVGKIDPGIKPKTLEAIVAMRQYIDSLSTEYVSILEQQRAELEADGSPEAEARAGLIEVITGNIGTYAHRSYKAFDDKNWYKKIPDSTLNAARKYMVDQHVENGETAEDAKRMAEVALHEITKNGTAYSSMDAFIRESKLGAKDLTVLKKRKQIAPEIRALLGEYIDPRVNFAKSATKMGRLVWNQRFLDRVRDLGMGTFLFEGKQRPPEATVQIAADGSDVYAPLNGLWTYPEIDTAFKDALAKEKMADWYRVMVQLNGMVKYGKTVLSPTTAARNWQSAMFFALANGHFDMRHMAKSVAGLREYFTNGGDKARLDYLRKLKKLGVVYDTPYAGEMMRLLEESKIDEMMKSKTAAPYKAFRSMNKFATKAYQYGDDFWKIIGFENEKAALIGAGMTEAQAETEAAERIRNTYPTYSMVGKAINWLRRFPLVGTFVSFPAEIIRTQGNILRYIHKDWTEGRKALALRRMAGQAFAAGTIYGLAAISKAMFGIDDEEEEAVRLMAAPWERNSNLLFTGRDDNGQLQYIDLSFLDPYNYFKRPITAILRDQTWEDSAADVFVETLKPFLGTDIAAGAIGEALFNKKDTGQPVYNEFGTPIEITGQIANHLRKALQPGIVSNIERTSKALQGERSSSGRTHDLGDEAFGWVGWRFRTLEPKTALYYRSFEFGDAKAEATKTLTQVLRDPNDIDDDDIRSAYQSAQRQQDEAYREMALIIQASKKNGLTDSQVHSVLKSSGVSDKDISMLLHGKTPLVQLSKQSLSNATKKARAIFDVETAREIDRRYRAANRMSRQQ